MSSIKKYELFHGAVLVRLMRSGDPYRLCMMETRAGDGSTYIVNDSVSLYIKYSAAPMKRKRTEDLLIWQFTFSPEHLAKLKEFKQKRQVFFSLVCGQETLGEKAMQICFLYPGEFEQCIDVDSPQAQTISVRFQTNKTLWVKGNNTKEYLKIPANALDNWIVPGE